MVPMAMIRNSMLPICFMKDAANCCSVWVRVSDAELANSPSMVRMAATACAGSLTRTTYQPTIACQ